MLFKYFPERNVYEIKLILCRVINGTTALRKQYVFHSNLIKSNDFLFVQLDEEKPADIFTVFHYSFKSLIRN